MNIKIKRVYAEPEKSDGFRILVDRLWPRGLTKQKAKVDLWLKEIAPSHELRKWFAHDQKRWHQFQSRYKEELKAHGEQLHLLREKSDNTPVTLLFGAKDEEHNEAVILQELLQHK